MRLREITLAVAIALSSPITTESGHFFVPDTEIKAPPQQQTKYIQVCNVSAYTSSADECGKADGITASGKMVSENHTIAADHLPFGTKVLIHGKEYVVEDRFGGGYTDRIDIYMESKEECFEFGRQIVDVEILK